MKSPEKRPLPEDVERMIAEEEAAAMARFRAGDFAGRMRRAVAAEGSPASPRPAARRVPGWAWAAAASLTAAGILAFLAVPKGGPAGKAGVAAWALSVSLPGLDGLSAWRRDAALAPAPETPAVPAFSAVLAKIATGGNVPAAAEAAAEVEPPHFGTERLIEILIRDRAVEKALSLVSTKFKEG